MPKLNTIQIRRKYEAHLQETLFDFCGINTEDVLPPIIPTDGERARTISNNEKGVIYELYIGSLYKSRGYDVVHVGGSNDMGIDLLCKQDKNYVVCIQCKYRVGKGVGVADIFEFYGAFKYYASQHLDKTVSGAFWTTQRFHKGTRIFRVAESLGIKLFTGILLPEGFCD